MKYIIDGKRLASFFRFYRKEWKPGALEVNSLDSYDYLQFSDE